MKNEKQLKEFLDDAVTTKLTVDVQYKPELSKIRKLIAKLYPNNGKAFGQMINCLFYKGGIPKDTSDPKIKRILDNFGMLYSLMNEANKSEIINTYLKQNFNISIEQTSDINSSVSKKVEKLYKNAFYEDYSGETAKEILTKSIEAGLSLTESIYSDNKKVDVEIYEQAEKKCQITDKQFKQTVGILLKEKKNNMDSHEILHNMISNLDQQKMSLEEIAEKAL